MQIEWFEADKAAAPLGSVIWIWNGEHHVGRCVSWGKRGVHFIGRDSLPIRGVTHWAYPISPDDIA